MNEGFYNDFELRKKKIAYHVAKRANLELEMLLRNFWSKKAPSITPKELEAFERLIEMDDLDLLELIIGKRKEGFDNYKELILEIREIWKLTRIPKV